MDTVKMFLALGALLFIVSSVDGRNLRIASYNIKVFGESKQKSTVAMDIITTIIHKYDVIQLQEVRGNLHIGKLMKKVGKEYAICSSQFTKPNDLDGLANKVFKQNAFKPHPSKSRYHEMYLFLYRTNVIKCHGTIECEEVDECPYNMFDRPPTAALFETVNSGKAFFVAGIHTKPKKGDTKKEIESLPTAHDAFMNDFTNKNFKVSFGAVMGDFNYGGQYVSSKNLGKLIIDTEMIGLLKKNTATAVKSGHPYDRIYVTKKSKLKFIAGVDRYIGGLSNPLQYYQVVSDHYPVYLEVSIKVASKKSSDSPPAKVDLKAIHKAITFECINLLTAYVEKSMSYTPIEDEFTVHCYDCCVWLGDMFKELCLIIEKTDAVKECKKNKTCHVQQLKFDSDTKETKMTDDNIDDDEDDEDTQMNDINDNR